MQRAEIRILKEMNQERLGSFLQCLDSMRLPAQLGAHIRGKEIERNLADQARKG